MKLFSEIRKTFHRNEINIVERLSTAEASFSIDFQELPNVIELRNICTLVPTRDTMTITFITDSNDIVRITNRQKEEPDISILTANLSHDDNIDVRIQIDKDVLDEKFSIYDFTSFTDDLLQRSTLDVMRWFSERLQAQKCMIFEVFDYDISLSTRTIAFESNDNATFKPKINRCQRLSSCKESAHFYNMNTFEIIPDDFMIEGITRAGDCLKPLFGKLATVLSLLYTASSASISDTAINIQINGQRTTSHELKLKDIQEDEKWINIYSWIYTDGNSTDKALIAHNVISLHCKYEPLPNIDAMVFDAIKTNYNLYLRSGVNQYLDMKRDIAKFIQSIVTQVGDYAVAILGKFKTNLVAMFGFLFTVVLTRIGSTQEWEEIFTRHTIYLIEIFLIGSFVYLLICIFETRYKLKKARHGYVELKMNYSDVLSEAELKEAFKDDKLLNETMQSAQRGLIGWSIVWGSLLVITIIVIEVFTANRGVFVWLWNNMC